MYVKAGRRSYWIEDDGKGTPLLFLHGFTGTGKTFDSIIKLFPDSLRTITIDMPGHGKTGEIGPVTMEQFSKDLALLLDELNLSKVHLLGYSMGGRAGLTFAMLYPDYIDTVILESASPGLQTTEQQLARQAKDQTFIDQLQKKGVESFVEDWEQLPLFKTQQNLSQTSRQLIKEERLSHTAQGLSQSLKGMGTGQQPSWWSRLTELEKRILLITGSKDEKFVELNKEMDALLPYSTYIEVKGAGHTVHLEEPKVFAKIVEEFVI
ncbi:2-succinyl-6-hydroxy-2,4-cyclohexadiene-1-carboxylate synthase [Halobacillus sp. A1]|uniref:2-succinyl-6-hydroxy-2, 4-cyclohexadiene-1-carboxylate synthase n=1 Tax=Halobacillus sp. A1 TaxID=2880262 RepID=UPI0020A69ED0|nr:2-succinyl-6-hydroxy-2,4-cyclohexadiene-1-carboxylate synthase [Halobacillus sp. A1]MCP3033377.1 2-succinyl-6-hydroxy-2,4-cyclohexadiene-1-carboxylate synthase [Halobacillus sp. A1]